MDEVRAKHVFNFAVYLKIVHGKKIQEFLANDYIAYNNYQGGLNY
jgi:hypothetical protein